MWIFSAGTLSLMQRSCSVSRLLGCSVTQQPSNPANRPTPCVYSSVMADLPQAPVGWRGRYQTARKTVWSWLTDPAVLLYRRDAHGRAKARVPTLEFFLF